MKRSISLFFAIVFVFSLFTAFSFSFSAKENILLSADELESCLGTVIADIDPDGDDCYFTEKNPLSIGYWICADDCTWSSHSDEHNEYPAGSGHCAQYIAQCTWYAYGRFLEVYGIALKGRIPNACDWLNVIPSNNADQGVVYSTDVWNPVVGSIFVKNNSSFGHVGFVEGISDDGRYVYYTDANYNISGSKTNLFDPTDGQVRKKTLESFVNGVVGYIFTDETALPGDQDGETLIMHTIATNNCLPGSVNVRSSPGGTVIGSLFYRDSVSAYPDSIVSVDGLDWIKIKYGGGVGYVAYKYLREGVAARTENIGRALSETELEGSIGVVAADIYGQRYTFQNNFTSFTEAWYVYGRFAELSDILLEGVSPDVSNWLTEAYKNNAEKGIIAQYGGQPQSGAIYITNNGSAGVIEGFSREGDSLKEYVYYSSYETSYKIKKAKTSDFIKDIKGYLFSHFVPVSQILSDTITIAMAPSDTYSVHVEVLPEDASDKSLVWSSDDETVAVVDNGLVRAVSPGETRINVMASSGIKETISVRVFETDVPVSDIEISTDSMFIDIGFADRITVNVVPDNASNKDVVFVSSDPGIASVSSLGIVYGKSMGSAVIDIVSGDGSVVKKCIVTVLSGQTAWSEWAPFLPELSEGTAVEHTIFFTYILPDGSWSEYLPYRIPGVDFLFCTMYRYELPDIIGDVNYSGDVTISDAMLLFKYVAGKLPEINMSRADMNADGNVGINDALLLFKIISGKL